MSIYVVELFFPPGAFDEREKLPTEFLFPKEAVGNFF